ncbi:pyridoxal phosphate-dependent aminotransferase [Candidatus Bandiella euplotis]|uniref:Aminotransferase n=1 Tax=Candidatus Bandiella euplotis TaxID=1664265 RepID=A0ABZ0UQQ2_9RICK|nr:pyridoxal phosphate-dependent aminotransferase [Candidatus Bandiella woodruffii]WPX97364.1 Aspartate aminotransferase [Candidatus Bandiella woodruffii]
MISHEQPLFLSKRLELIKPSPTLAVSNKAKDLKSQGKDVIDLGAGEPDFDTPEHIKQAAFDAIKSGKTKYTAVDGILDLKRAIIKKLIDENGLEYQPEQITVGCGAKHVLFNVFAATLNPGDEVIIPAPFWVSYPDMTLINGGLPVIVTTKAENNFKITPEELEKNITNKTKWLVINSPNNPTGFYYTAEELQMLAKVLDKHPHVNIISDAIYEHIRYGGEAYVNIANISDDMKARTFVVNGVSKTYSMTGWRIGYGAGNKELVKAISKIQSQSTSNPCSISQYASVEALSKNSAEFIEQSKKRFEERCNLVIGLLKNIRGITTPYPNGAFYIFPSCEQLIGKRTQNGRIINDDSDFADYLLEEALVAVVPGIAFGTKNFFRISYATSEELLKEACARIKLACDKLS